MDNLPTLTVSNTPSVLHYIEHLDKQLQFADVLLKSRMVPQHFTSKEAVYVAILWGQELGFSPVQAVNSIIVIQGTPTLTANTIKALIASRGGTLTPTEWTDKLCKIEMTRPGWTKATYSYSIDEASQAGLSTKDNWKRMPKDMLFARAVSRGARNMWADVLKGIYSTEEMRDSVEVEYRHVPEAPRATIAALIKETQADDLVKSKELTEKALAAQAEKQAIVRDSHIKKLLKALDDVGVPQIAVAEFVGTDPYDMTDTHIQQLKDIGKRIKAGEPAAEFFNLEFLEVEA